jgi:hypothetical protein
LGLIVEKFQCGAIIDNKDVMSTKEFILSLYHTPEIMERLKKNSRLASEKFTSKNAELYYQKIAGVSTETVIET